MASFALAFRDGVEGLGFRGFAPSSVERGEHIADEIAELLPPHDRHDQTADAADEEGDDLSESSRARAAV